MWRRSPLRRLRSETEGVRPLFPVGEIMVLEPYYITRPVMHGGINGGYIVLDRRWGINKKDLMNFSIHIHGYPDKKFHITKAVGSRGNSLVMYLPCNWEIPIGALCVVEATPVKNAPRHYSCEECPEEEYDGEYSEDEESEGD